MTSETSAEEGPYRFARTPYLREIAHYHVHDPRPIVLMFASQMAKTEFMLSCLAYNICVRPAPSMWVGPTKKFNLEFSKDRVSPLIRNTKSLQGLIEETKRGDKNNTILHRGFVGGSLSFASAENESELSSKPECFLYIDEIDRFSLSAQGKGDALSLAIQRTVTFGHRRRIIVTSTPGIEGMSRVAQLYDQSTQARLECKCVHCHDFHEMQFSNVAWNEEAESPHKTARYICPKCKTDWTEAARLRAIAESRWIHANPNAEWAGFYVSALASPWVTIQDGVKEYLAKREYAEQLKAWTNLYLGLPYKDETGKLDEHILQKRAEKIEFLDDRIRVITCGIDTQMDRFECVVVGWSEGEECWILEQKIIVGDTTALATQNELSMFIDSTQYVYSDGSKLNITHSAIDTGGADTISIYQYIKRRFSRKIYGIKGRSATQYQAGKNEHLWPLKPTYTKFGIKIYGIGVSTIKEILFNRLRITKAGNGYIHFSDVLDVTFYEQLTSERLVYEKTRNGYLQRIWQKDSSRRNEALDCFVYAYACLQGLKPNWQRLERVGSSAIAEQAEMEIEPEEQISVMHTKTKNRTRRSKTWATNW